MRKSLFIICIILLLNSNITFAQEYDDSTNDSMIPVYAKGQVIEVIEQELDIELSEGILTDEQTLNIKITSGPFKGQVFKTENSTSGNMAYDMWFSEGDKVVLYIETIDGKLVNGYVMDFVRDTYMYILIFLFIIVLIAIGRSKGLKSVFTLAFTILVIAKFLLPLLYKGYNPVFLALISGIIITTVTLFVIGGFSKKSIAAIFGTAGGLLTAAVISIIFGKMSNLKGLSGEEAQMLMYIPENINLDFQGLLFAGIMIGALGAVMDVCISIASSMEEIKNVGGSLTFKEMFRSGMNIGKDIMGTMSNTLILAYTGSSIPLMLLLMAYDESLVKLMNMEFISSEVIRALSGSIGLLLAIPITAFLAALLMRTKSDSIVK